MAGIGFYLQKILQRDTYLAILQSYFYSALVSSGPWIFTITSLFLLNAWASYLVSAHAHHLFQVTITYTFAFSLILVGIFQMGVSRYVSDLFFAEQLDDLLPSFFTVMLIVGVSQAVVAACFWLPAPFSWFYRLLAIELYVIVSLLWVSIVYLSVAKEYRSIAFAFVIGSFAALVLGSWGGYMWQAEGLLAGFACGEFLILFLLVRRLLDELPGEQTWHWQVLSIFRSYPFLIATSVLYNIGIWVDKFVFWHGPEHVYVGYLLSYNPIYDNASFFAFITVIPSLAFFVIQVETRFYQKYRAFYGSILFHKDYETIEKHKQEIVKDLHWSLVRLLKIQGVITLILVIFTPLFLELLGMKWLQVSLIRSLCLGAFLHMVFLILSIVLLYFDLQREVFGLVLLFAVTNFAASYVSTFFDLRFFGLGYLFACLVSVLAALHVLARSLDRLEYITFVKQNLARLR